MTASPTFTITISKVNELLLKGEARSVTLPGTEGQMTLLAHHEPLITLLKEGVIIVREGDEIKEFPITKGLCEVSHGQVTILV